MRSYPRNSPQAAARLVALAMLADGQSDTAGFRTRLDKVLADPGHPWFDLAGKIQKRLKTG